MSVVETDLLFMGALNMCEDDVSTVGGAIDTTCKVVFTDISAVDDVEVLSSAAGDNTQTVTITGRSAAGALVSDTYTLNGTTPVVGANTREFERIMKIVISGSHTGTITVRKESDNVTIATLEPGILSVRRMFYNSSAEATGGSTREYFEKFYVYNSNATTALTSVTIAENSDPTTRITFDLEDAVDDNNSISDRLGTAPTGMLGSFDNTTKSVPGGILAPESGIGIWLKLTLPSGTSPTKSTWGPLVSGLTS